MVYPSSGPKAQPANCRPRASGSGSSSADSVEAALRQHEQLRPNSHSPGPLRCFFNALVRKKPLDCRTDTNLNRCLNLLQLTALGVGSTLGLGLYVLAGQVASNKAGPGVVISFAMAAVASAFSALCYAEFAGLVPKAGSAYAYSYITVGEFVAFVIGWNLILEYVIGTASVARGFSGYLQLVYRLATSSSAHELALDQRALELATSGAANSTGAHLSSLAGNATLTMATSAAAAPTLIDSLADYVARYFDWPSVAIITVITVCMLLGVRESTNVTLAFTSVNIVLVIIVVMSSLRHLDARNWSLAKHEVPHGFGEGGFLPYGWSGVIAGSATCFFGFIGFDSIASSAEEAKNPKRNVPLSIILSLFISFVAYMAVAIVQTLLWPYYDQNKVTILPYIFGRLAMPVTYWVVLVGAVAGLASSQVGGMYPLPRILYSMAQDKLIYSYMAHVNKRLRLPVRATVIGALFVAALACLLDIQDLADMVSIGTLAAYSLVSLSVLILRYEHRRDAVDDSTLLSSHLTFNDILSVADTHLKAPFEPHLQLQVHAGDKPPHTHAATTIAGNADHTTQLPAQAAKTPLATKASIPIRERGSRAVVAQLSAGFESWFKSASRAAPADAACDEPAGAVSLPTSAATPKQQPSKRLNIWRLLAPSDAAKTGRSASATASPLSEPTEHTSHLSKILIVIIIMLTIVIDVVAVNLLSLSGGESMPTASDIGAGQTADNLIERIFKFVFGANMDAQLALSCVAYVALAALLAALVTLARLPTSKLSRSDAFQVPLVPLIPTLSILVNTFLMLNLSYLTWVRFTVWMAMGLFIYFTYGLWHSRGYLLHIDK